MPAAVGVPGDLSGQSKTASQAAATTESIGGDEGGSEGDGRLNQEASSNRRGGRLQQRSPSSTSWKQRATVYRPLLAPAAKASALFVLCLIALILLLHALLPPVDDADKDALKIPRSFEDLKRLNQILQIYKQRNFGRVLGSFIALYLLYVMWCEFSALMSLTGKPLAFKHTASLAQCTSASSYAFSVDSLSWKTILMMHSDQSCRPAQCTAPFTLSLLYVSALQLERPCAILSRPS